MPLILPGNVATALGGAYEVANSLRFDDGSSDYLNKTPSSAGSRTTWTWSAWVKRSDISPTNGMFEAYEDSNNFTYIRFAPSYIRIFNRIGGSTKAVYNTSAFYRDVSAWYHIVWIWDTTNGTAGNRSRLYINGTRVTNFSTETNPTSGEESWINNNDAHYIGSTGVPSLYFNGYMSEVCFIDGTALEPTSFGEFDSDSPTIWKPIDVSDLTFGTNGFYLDFEDSSALGNDVSGNNNDWTANNLTAVDQSTDTCTNNFATLNPLSSLTTSSQAFTEGNLVVTNSSGGMRQYNSTIAAATGKWYCEVKVTSVGGDAPGVGIIDPSKFVYNSHIAGTNDGYCYLYGGNKQYNGSSVSYGDSWTTNDIIGIAMDLTNSKLYFSKNGTFQNSGDPTSGSTGTGSAYDIVSGVFYTFGGSTNDVNTDPVYSWNFGGTQSFTISSGNADANGYGNFEYAVPSGYYALNTKNLAEFGG